jgi:hypothetical protein
MIDQLTQGATPHTPPNYPGVGYNLSAGGWIGYRGPPTIDVNIPGIPIQKVKFK